MKQRLSYNEDEKDIFIEEKQRESWLFLFRFRLLVFYRDSPLFFLECLTAELSLHLFHRLESIQEKVAVRVVCPVVYSTGEIGAVQAIVYLLFHGALEGWADETDIFLQFIKPRLGAGVGSRRATVAFLLQGANIAVHSAGGSRHRSSPSSPLNSVRGAGIFFNGLRMNYI